MIRTFLAAMAALVFLSACEPTPPAVVGDGSTAEQLAAAAAAEINQDRGDDLGGGLILLGATSQGSVTIMQLQIPLPAGTLSDGDRRLFGDAVTEGFAIGFCEDAGTAQLFFALGASLQVEFYGTDGVLVSRSRIDRC